MNQLAQINFATLQPIASKNFGPGSSLADLISGSLTNLLFFGAGTLALLYLLYGGLTYMLSRGDPKAVSAAQQRLTYAVIGLIIVFCSFWIVQLARLFLGFSDFGIANPTS
jgi:hypothetical protein